MDNNIIEPTPALLKMQNEVKEIHERILTACETDEKLKKVYSGCIIYWSPLYKNPNILFFGINPSDRYGMLNKFDPEKAKPAEDDDFKKDLRECFKAINKPEYLESMVFTNRYFFATKNSKELRNFFDLVNKHFPDYEIQLNQEEWTQTLINELSPKLIIVSGLSIDEKFDKLGAITLEQSKHTKVMKINGIVIIAYKRDNQWNRNKMSKKTKQEFIQLLGKYTNES
jgi:hypothetical protein